jgi:tRNA-specific 2-thiouridylase
MKKQSVAIGLSGGVDSAVSAVLLKRQGYEVTGVFLYCFDSRKTPCTVDEDRAMAVKVADHIGIPIKIIDLRSQYRRSVVEYFFSEYRNGRTPNPDVMCNREIKFGLFYREAIENWGMNFVATGHYSRILNYKFEILNNVIEQTVLAKGVDKTKDQSYFLYNLKERQLEHILFPIGELRKHQVRTIAKQFNLPNWDRPDSQGICFIGEVDVRKFISTKLKPKKGLVLSSKGEIIGEHDGVWFYTIGQRHGYKITQNSKARLASGQVKSQKTDGKPMYILGKNSERNELIVGYKEDCYSKKIELENFHLINPRTFSNLSDLSLLSDLNNLNVRIRHLGELYPCKVFYERSGIWFELKKPAFAVAPGQSAVLYYKDIVLGGGVIC